MKIRMKDLRIIHKLYQQDMANILGTSQSVISRMELRDMVKINLAQYSALCEKFGKKDVDTYLVEDSEDINISGNTNKGRGQQNNGFFGSDTHSLDIIRKQTQLIENALNKQSEQTDRLLALLEKISERL